VSAHPSDPARLAAAVLLLWIASTVAAGDWRCVSGSDGAWVCTVPGARVPNRHQVTGTPTAPPTLATAAVAAATGTRARRSRPLPARASPVRALGPGWKGAARPAPGAAAPAPAVQVSRPEVAARTALAAPSETDYFVRQASDAVTGASAEAGPAPQGEPATTPAAAAAAPAAAPAADAATSAAADLGTDPGPASGADAEGGTGAPAAARADGPSAGTPAVPDASGAEEEAVQNPTPERTPTGAKKRNADLLHEGLTWEFCGQRPPGFGPASLPPPPGEEDQVYIGADAFDYDRDLKLLWLDGDVRLTQGNRAVAADKVVYDRDSADLLAKGNVFLANPGIRMLADEAEINLSTDKGSLRDVRYRLAETANARGTAARAEIIDPTLTRYYDIRYSACRPGQDAWALDARRLDLDQAKGRGIARHATLLVRGVPVFYTPYVSFPIDDRRKSGFLIPTFGNSDENGLDLTLPYYWNIAPNMDATFFPRYLGRRGTMLGTEFRFLSRRQEAEIYGEVLPDDRLREDNRTRWGLRIDQKGQFARRWSTDVSIDAVSDDEYFEDFGNRLELTSTRNIERRGDLAYQGDGWTMRTRLQDFQTLDETIPPSGRPYKRLPQVALSKQPYRLDPGIQLGLEAEFDAFEHDAKVQGQRLTLQPYARWPLRKIYGRLIPEVNLYLADYALQDAEPAANDGPSYVIPSFNLDGDLVFERSIRWLGQGALQTLEPRLYYLYTPVEDQDDIPVFDSDELSFSYYSLFQPNRFSGRDRIGDANQLTLGLTSRTLARRSGRELLRASVGQTLYFQDREVQIVGPAEDTDSSAIAGILSARLFADVTGSASFEYDPNLATDRSRKRAFELYYRDREDRLVNLAYRFDIGETEETRYEDTDVSFRWPVSDALEFVGRWNYSLLNSQTVEAFAGLEFGQCCWRMRLLGRHLKNKPDTEGNNTVLVQVELAGLGAIGQGVDRFLERSIYGYYAD